MSGIPKPSGIKPPSKIGRPCASQPPRPAVPPSPTRTKQKGLMIWIFRRLQDLRQCAEQHSYTDNNEQEELHLQDMRHHVQLQKMTSNENTN
ncbi:hypothetical protein J6590_017900 [Homalodisca vitripennis]|nr:hypothetical protein J6590_017900 [Homalodisca vitripennis]